MTPERFATLIEGVLAHWEVAATACFDDTRLRCRIRVADGEPVSIAHEHSALGDHWRVQVPGRTPRVHRSVVPALAGLREALCPQRLRGRALFVTAPGDAS